MVKLLKKLRNIIIGNINNLLGLKEELSSPRMIICNRCEYVKDVLCLGKICTKCGCLLKAKTKVKNEYCKLNKW